MAVIEVDFTGVESSGGFLAPGAYEAQVQNIELRDGRNYPGLKFTWVSTESDTDGQRADQFVSLAPKALWKFKGILGGVWSRDTAVAHALRYRPPHRQARRHPSDR